jgi:N-dimethylarginine dimethylaminohydrolase
MIMVFNSHGRLRSILLCKPTYYEICDFSDVASQHLKEGFKVSRKVATEQHQEFAETLEQLKVPIIGRVIQGSLEGGDCWYLDEHTLVIGIGNRSTMEGVKEAEKILEPFDIKVIPVQFEAKWNHLDIIFSVVTPKTVMLCLEALPDDFLKYLRQEKYEIITIPGDAVFAGTINLLALGDEKVLSFKENKIGNGKLRALGLEVFDPPLSQFLMGGSGPHCLSFELIRDKH